MGLDCIHSILAKTPTALLVIENQIGSPRAIHLQCSNSLRTGLLNMCITIPVFQENAGGCGRPGRSSIVTSSIMVYSSTGGSLIPSLASTTASDSPCMENLRAPSSGMYFPCSSGEYISPESLHLSESITGAQQL